MRIVIVTAATGHGHLAAAGALKEAAEARGHQVSVIDIGQCHRLLRLPVALYNAFLRRPPQWMSLFFGAVNTLKVDRLAFRFIGGWAHRQFLATQPHLIVSVHPMVNYAIAELAVRVRFQTPFVILTTDYAPPFWRGWAEPRATATLVSTVEAKQQLAAWGVPQERIQLASMPVRSIFRQLRTEEIRRQTLQRLGLDSARLTVVLSAGLAARRSALNVYQALAEAPALTSRIQTIVLAGRDQRIFTAAQRMRAPFPTSIQPWRDDIETIFAAADLLFTKPGGSTVSEALAAGVPLLLDACGGVMPQERGTAHWVVERQLGWLIRNPHEVAAVVGRLTPQDLAEYRRRLQEVVRGDAASVLDLVESHISGYTTIFP